jgi:hypothetical protein
VAHLDRAAGGHNLVALTDLRKHLAAQGITDRKAQDAALLALRGKELTFSALEGRHGISQAENDAAIPQPDGSRLGFVSRREQPAPKAAPQPAGTKAPVTAEAIPEVVKRIDQVAYFEHSTIPAHEFAGMLRRKVPGLDGLTPGQFGDLVRHLSGVRTPDGKRVFEMSVKNEVRELTPEQRKWTPDDPAGKPLGFVHVGDDVDPAAREKAVTDALHAYLAGAPARHARTLPRVPQGDPDGA